MGRENYIAVIHCKKIINDKWHSSAWCACFISENVNTSFQFPEKQRYCLTNKTGPIGRPVSYSSIAIKITQKYDYEQSTPPSYMTSSRQYSVSIHAPSMC